MTAQEVITWHGWSHGRPGTDHVTRGKIQILVCGNEAIVWQAESIRNIIWSRSLDAARQSPCHATLEHSSGRDAREFPEEKHQYFAANGFIFACSKNENEMNGQHVGKTGPGDEWDVWDDTALQTQALKFGPWWFEAGNATSRSRRLPTILDRYEWAGKKHCVSLKLEDQCGARACDFWFSKQSALAIAPVPSLAGSGFACEVACSASDHQYSNL